MATVAEELPRTWRKMMAEEREERRIAGRPVTADELMAAARHEIETVGLFAPFVDDEERATRPRHGRSPFGLSSDEPDFLPVTAAEIDAMLAVHGAALRSLAERVAAR